MLGQTFAVCADGIGAPWHCPHLARYNAVWGESGSGYCRGCSAGLLPQPTVEMTNAAMTIKSPLRIFDSFIAGVMLFVDGFIVAAFPPLLFAIHSIHAGTVFIYHEINERAEYRQI